MKTTKKIKTKRKALTREALKKIKGGTIPSDSMKHAVSEGTKSVIRKS